MALRIEPNQSATAYHIVDGATYFPYAVDAAHAIGTHPFEWSDSPWSPERASEARTRLNERNQSEGNPIIPDPVPLHPDDQAALDTHNAAVAEAAERLAAYYKKRDEDNAVAAQVKADEALVASIPPQPDPAVRRPLSPAQLRKQSAQLTPQEQADKDAADQRDAQGFSQPDQKARDDAAKKARDDADAAARKAADDRTAAAAKAEVDRNNAAMLPKTS